MSVWPGSSSAGLHGSEGDLLSVRITVEAYWLEDLLDALAQAPFPINPDILHQPSGLEVTVEFPAWRRQVADVQQALSGRHFEAQITVSGMLEEIQAC